MANLNFMEKDILMSKEDYGVCYCGGGFRACVLTYGSVSEIENIIGKIKYIGGVSGSTWFIVGYTYYNDKIKFDKYLNPENCTIDNLNLFDGDTFGNALSKVDLMKEMGSGFTDSSDTKINNWITDIYNSFFKIYQDEKTNYDVKKTPYPLIYSSIYYDDIDERLFSIEFTPDYACVPIYYKKNNIGYGGYNIGIKESCQNYELVPYVQSGLSSSASDAIKEHITNNRFKGTTYNLFNPNTNQINTADLVDGGMFDNCGITGLLRRKVKNIHVNIFPNEPLTSRRFMKSANYLTMLFIGNPDSEKYGIFKLGLWDKIYNQLLYKLENGLPLTVLMKTDVLSNEFFQIEGYKDVNFLFHVSSCSHNWFSKLPNETQKYIKINISKFPYIDTLTFKLNSIEINLMYNCIKYDIQNSPEYKEFYHL
jgi:hypothetical protein